MGKDRKNIGFNYVFPYFLQEFKEKVASLLSANGARTKPKEADGSETLALYTLYNIGTPERMPGEIQALRYFC